MLLRQSAVHFRQKEPDVGKLLYGKRKNVTHNFRPTRMNAAALLEKVPNEALANTVKRVLSVEELSADDLLGVMRSNRALKRLDRNDIIYETVKNVQPKMLNAYHFSLLMAHANNERKTDRALEFWKDAVRCEKVNPKLHGALLQAYRNEGKWTVALEHCDTMFEDKVELDVHGLHSVLNNCRKNSPWYTGLQFFSKAVGQGVKPNAVVYLELLRMLEHAHPMPNRWRYGLAILSALQGRVDVTAGHYNSVLATLGGGHWQRGVQLFHTMRENSVQPSKETLHTLLLLQPNNVSHTIRCIAEAHTLGMPVTDTMYRALLTGLVRRSLDHEAVKFIDKELSRDTVDTGNPVRTTLPLMTALLDTLLAHPRPHDALVMAETFENKLSDVVGASTRNLAEIGSATLRWLVQGRVAIVDHNVLLSPRFQSLIHHYDSIFIPFSSVRLLVRRAREGGDSVQGRYMRTVLLRLREMLNQPEWRMVRVLPFVHQLTAHRYIAEEEPFSTEALEEMREEAKKLPSSFGQQLLNGISGVGDTARDTLAIREVDQPAPAVITTKKKRGIFLRHKDTLTSIERVLSVAVMIKSLNPDADVHVLSTNARQLELVEKWNGFTTDEAQHGQTLQAVLYPSELFDKAPPPDASSAVVEEKEETQESALDSSKLPFIPS